MTRRTMIVRGVLPVAVAVASLLTPLATAVASELSVSTTDTSTTDTSLTEPVDDTTTDTTDTTDATLDDAVESTDGDDTLLDDGDELTGAVDDLVEDGEETTDATTTEVESVVTGDEAEEEDDGQTEEEEGQPEEEEGQSEEEGQPATEDGAGDNGAEDDTSAQRGETGEQSAAAADREQADGEGQGRDARRTPGGLRSPVAPPPEVWNGERAATYEELLGGHADEPPLGPRAQVHRASEPTPPELMTGVAELTYVPSAGPRSTKPIMDILRGTGALPSTTARIMAPFPIAGFASYGDDWGAPRHGGRQHRGVDVFASRGTPIIASMDGVITGLRHHQGLGGNWLRVQAPDGTYLYYAHLEAFGPGIENGVSVVRGQVLGTVGTSGNARGTPPHLHLQIHPGGGAPVPPQPYLDRWLDQAYQAAQSYEASTGGVPAPQVAPPASAEVTTAFGPAGQVPAPVGSPDVSAGGSYALERASTSTGGPATVGLVVLGVIAWAMLRRPRRRDDEEARGFIDLGHAPPPPDLPLRLHVPEVMGLPDENERHDRELVGANTP